MGKLIKILFVLLLLSLVAIVGLFLTAIESQPLVVASSGEQVNNAESVKTLMKQLNNSLVDRTNKQDIKISQNQLNSLVGFAQRANGKVNGKVNITRRSTSILTSYQLPQNPIGQYINLDILILPGEGINVSHVKVGPLTIPGNLALGTVVTLANWYTSSDIASQFVKQVESVTMTDQQVSLSVLPLDQFLQELNEVKQGVGGVDDEEMRLRTAYYLKQLSLLDIGKRSSAQSLAKFTGPLFTWAKNRSTYDTAAKENEAAIMALAIYAGHHRFANLVGDVQPIPGRVALPSVKPTLKSRTDLNQHFIFSAAIKVMSEQGVSMAIGEFKELMDRSRDGSGYSFIDLAADFAGVEFAVTATDTATASALQYIMAGNTDERTFFPDTQRLPEGLSKAEFTRQFEKVDSPKYLQMVKQIQQRIATLPIHQSR